MLICPKCRSLNVAGPNYRRDELGREALTYRCIQCGFTRDEQTADAPRRGVVDAQAGDPRRI